MIFSPQRRKERKGFPELLTCYREAFNFEVVYQFRRNMNRIAFTLRPLRLCGEIVFKS